MNVRTEPQDLDLCSARRPNSPWTTCKESVWSKTSLLGPIFPAATKITCLKSTSRLRWHESGRKPPSARSRHPPTQLRGLFQESPRWRWRWTWSRNTVNMTYLAATSGCCWVSMQSTLRGFTAGPGTISCEICDILTLWTYTDALWAVCSPLGVTPTHRWLQLVPAGHSGDRPLVQSAAAKQRYRTCKSGFTCRDTLAILA